MTKYLYSDKVSYNNCLVLPLFEEKALDSFAKNLDQKMSGLISQAISGKDFEGKKLQMFWLLQGKERVLLMGMGKEKAFNLSVWKRAVGSSVITVQNKKINNFSVFVPEAVVKKIGMEKTGQETLTACEIANYAFDDFKTDKDAKVTKIDNIELVCELDVKDKKKFLVGVEIGKVIGDGVNFARHLGNIPPTVMTPSLLAKEAENLGRTNKKIKVKILDRTEMKKLGMGCLLAVARGSKLEPKFIIVEYFGATKKDKSIVMVGKGITYDSGGLSLKSGDSMLDMKYDMLGAATVLGAIKTAGALDLKKNIVVLIPSAENMPGGDAYRPDDILTAMNGKTVEIQNTDAEGRLVLADALCYADKYNAKEVVDAATLTGACMGALGGERSGLFAPDDKLSDKLLNFANAVGENLWRLPLGEEYSEAMKSNVADIKNVGGVGGSRYGTASTAAAFLQFFTNDAKGEPLYNWAHIDLASALFSTSHTKPWLRHGANGFGVQLLVEYLRG